MSIREELPTEVDVAITGAVSRLQAMHEALEQGRRADAMFGGGGRYEAEVIHHRYGSLKQLLQTVEEKQAVIRKWRERCPSGIDFEKLLTEYGEIPEIAISEGGSVYLSDLTCCDSP